LVFIGPSVSIRSRKTVSIGRFTRIEGHVELDGYGAHGLQIGSHCKIGRFSVIRVPPLPYLRGAGIFIGNDSTFAEYCFVGGASQVTIGSRNAFGQYVSLHPQDHLPKKSSEVITRSIGITVGDDNWFGAKSTVLDGVTIGSHCIVAAAAVVRGQVGDGLLLAGVPAIVKRRLNEAAADR
jgi:acetyltransferase-like isoleucine patch superfamily enzyme